MNIYINEEQEKGVHSPYLFNIAFEVLARAIRQLRDTEGMYTGRENLNYLYLQTLWFYAQNTLITPPGNFMGDNIFSSWVC